MHLNALLSKCEYGGTKAERKMQNEARCSDKIVELLFFFSQVLTCNNGDTSDSCTHGIHSGGPYSHTKRSVWSMLVFVVTVSYKVAVSPESVSTAQLLLQEITRLGSCQRLVTFSSASQHILFRDSLCNVYC